MDQQALNLAVASVPSSPPHQLITVNPASKFSITPYLDLPTIPPNLSYLWIFYLEKTFRICAIHEFSTPFLTSIVPMAATSEVLQQALMQLSCIYRNIILKYNDYNYSHIMLQLDDNCVRGFQHQIHNVNNYNQAQTCTDIATCLTLLLCAIGNDDQEKYNVHMYGALILVTQILIPNPALELSPDTWFLVKWTSYAVITINLNNIASSSHLETAKGFNYPAILTLYNWWQENAQKDSEYHNSIDSFYGFSTKLIPLLLQFNLLIYRKQTYQSIGAQEISNLEAALQRNCTHNTSKYTTSTKLNTIDNNYNNCLYINSEYSTLFHYNNCVQSASLLWFYVYLKPYDSFFFSHAHLSAFLSTMIQDLKYINPESPTTSGLLFIIYILGSVTTIPEHRAYLADRLTLLKTKSFANVETVSKALEYIWMLKAQNPFINVVDCHAKVCQQEIHVCLY